MKGDRWLPDFSPPDENIRALQTSSHLPPLLSLTGGLDRPATTGPLSAGVSLKTEAGCLLKSSRWERKAAIVPETKRIGK